MLMSLFRPKALAGVLTGLSALTLQHFKGYLTSAETVHGCPKKDRRLARYRSYGPFPCVFLWNRPYEFTEGRLASIRFSPFGLSAFVIGASGSIGSSATLGPTTGFPSLLGRSLLLRLLW